MYNLLGSIVQSFLISTFVHCAFMGTVLTVQSKEAVHNRPTLVYNPFIPLSQRVCHTAVGSLVCIQHDGVMHRYSVAVDAGCKIICTPEQHTSAEI